MSAIRKSKSKAKRSPSISPSVSSAQSLEIDDISRNRKRMAPESNELGSQREDVHPSPTKRYKRSTPGSPEYESQPAVVITAEHGHKPLRRRLSFGLNINDEVDEVPMTEENTLKDEEASPVENIQRSRRPSQKAAYMADTPTRTRKDHHVSQRSAVKNHAAKSVVIDTPTEDTDIIGGAVLSSQKKRPVPRPTKKPTTVPAVKREQASDVELEPLSQQPKGKAPARLESPVVISSDESGLDQFPDPPNMRGRPSGTIPNALENQRTSQGLPTTSVTKDTDVASGAMLSTQKKRPAPRLKKKLVTVPAVKHEQFSDIELWPVSHQSKGKAPAHPESPVIVSSDESGSDMFSDTPKAKGRNHGTTATVDSVKEGLLSPTASGGEQDTGVADATPSHLCTIRPTDSNKTPAYAPADLRDPDTDKPIFLQSHLFPSIFEEPMLSSLTASLNFESLPPFVNPSKFPPGDLTISDYRNVIWPGSKQNAVCMMFGAVHSCNIIHYAMAGSNKIRALTIIPSAAAFDSFRQFLWKQYAAPEIYGPFDYGCLLTFTSRREGLTSSYSSSQPQVSPERRRRNMKVFGSSATAPPATHWYEKNFPPFVDYDQDIPIYDASSRPFMFTKEDFAALPSFPRYKKTGDRKHAEVPANGLVSVFFGMNTYASTRVPPTPGSSTRSYQNNNPQTPVASGSSSQNDKASSQVLSLNLHFVIYHGQVPEPNEED